MHMKGSLEYFIWKVNTIWQKKNTTENALIMLTSAKSWCTKSVNLAQFHKDNISKQDNWYIVNCHAFIERIKKLCNGHLSTNFNCQSLKLIPSYLIYKVSSCLVISLVLRFFMILSHIVLTHVSLLDTFFIG